MSIARRVLGERRIGHTGTLDPFATGLLLLLVGRATRLAQYVRDEPKVYDALVRFGAETDTEDLHGTVIREALLPTPEALQRALPAFVGEIDQVPPAYSAKRIDGKRAYAIARTGQAVELPSVRVMIHACTIEPVDAAHYRLRVSCGGGTYIRSLARDLARAVGSAAHLVELRRLSAGVFSVDAALTLDRLKAGEAVCRPPAQALEGYPVQQLDEDDVARVARGIDVEARIPGDYAALIDARGALIAFAQHRPSERGDRWQPRVVMHET